MFKSMKERISKVVAYACDTNLSHWQYFKFHKTSVHQYIFFNGLWEINNFHIIKCIIVSI